MKFGIVVFPGSNCDHDCYHVIKDVCKEEAVFLWHKEHDLKNCDCIILPGGFSYGDYLRSGAIAGKSPIINEVVNFANKGGYILGICNGFQVLTETHLLPGVLMRNRDLSFICKNVDLTVENNKTPFTIKYQKGDVISVPIAHMDGCYFADDATIKSLEDNEQIVFKYSGENPNGALKDIAGICSKNGRVLGMMPHPERCSETELGGIDGRDMFESIIHSFESK